MAITTRVTIVSNMTVGDRKNCETEVIAQTHKGWELGLCPDFYHGKKSQDFTHAEVDPRIPQLMRMARYRDRNCRTYIFSCFVHGGPGGEVLYLLDEYMPRHWKRRMLPKAAQKFAYRFDCLGTLVTLPGMGWHEGPVAAHDNADNILCVRDDRIVCGDWKSTRLDYILNHDVVRRVYLQWWYNALRHYSKNGYEHGVAFEYVRMYNRDLPNPFQLQPQDFKGDSRG